LSRLVIAATLANMSVTKFAAVAVTACCAVELTASANPIRKVVTMLQNMQAKVAAEGEKEAKLFDNFMCYCKNNGGDLTKSIADAEAKIGALPSQIEEAEANLKQLKADVKQAQDDRSSAKSAMAEATAIRAKEAASFAKETGDLKTNIAALTKAVTALEKGMAGAFLQTTDAQVLRSFVVNAQMNDADRDDLTAFLSASSSYAPASGQITGILKQMSDTMKASVADAKAKENGSIETYNALMKAKTAEVNALTSAIESKTERSGEVGVEIVQMKEDLSDTEKSYMEDKKFLAELDKGCSTKEGEWAQIKKTRAEELVALSETIKMLNDDDALELFKKTLPSASSLIQLAGPSSRKDAIALLQNVVSERKGDRQRLDFIMLALRGKSSGFEKVVGMIDDMVKLLGKEQIDDENKKESCNIQFDSADDKMKALTRRHGKVVQSQNLAGEQKTQLTEEIATLTAGINSLDKMVAEATQNRKDENSNWKELFAQDTAAKEVLHFARNRLNKFYNPKLYKAPKKRELSDQDQIVVNMGGTLAPTAAPGGIGGTGIEVGGALVQIQEHGAPPPPPETFGAYSTKREESNGVIAMMDLLIKDLETELTQEQTEEKLAQEEYTQLMADSAEKRATDSKSLSDKGSALADTETQLVELTGAKKSVDKELMATDKYISGLHATCDWLLKFFDVRNEARAGEVDALKKAKAILSGADYSFVQTRSVKFLRRA